jgi:putative redox protein
LALVAELADIAAVAVIGTPSDVRVLHGEKVSLLEAVALIRTPLLILHSPEDEVVDISHATKIFAAARHPKSYVSLGNADHFFTSNNDASSVGRMISSWSSQFLEREYPMEGHTSKDATARETGQGKYQTVIQSGKHRFVADEPVTVGGMDSGPSPYDLISAALGSCTAMTIRQYADFKNFQLGRVTVRVGHSKLLAQDCAECTAAERAAGGRIDLFRREIWVEGEINEELSLKIVAIADKCPVHRTLERAAVVVTKFVEAAAA